MNMIRPDSPGNGPPVSPVSREQPSSLEKSVGTTTIVRASSGIPAAVFILWQQPGRKQMGYVPVQNAEGKVAGRESAPVRMPQG